MLPIGKALVATVKGSLQVQIWVVMLQALGRLTFL